MNPAIEAFLRADTIWNTINGAIIVSDNQDVPLKPHSIDSITVSITTHANIFFKTFRAL